MVSLKEGMFNNANVIFRTKFVDGVSAVGRTVNRSAGPAARTAETVGSGKSRKRGKTSAGVGGGRENNEAGGGAISVPP